MPPAAPACAEGAACEGERKRGGGEGLDDAATIHADLAALMNRFAEAMKPAIAWLP